MGFYVSSKIFILHSVSENLPLIHEIANYLILFVGEAMLNKW